jgi:hypothetical protein
MSFGISLLKFKSDRATIRRGQEQMIVDLIGFRLVADDLQYIMPSETLSMAPAVVLLVGLIDNAHRLFPEVTHSAMTFLSLCVVRSPSSLLGRLDPIPLISSTRLYLLGVAGLLRSRCKVERMFSISHALNMIPMLYFLGEWTMSKNLLAEQDIPMILSVFFLDIMHIACSGVGDDVQFDVKSYPELSDAKIHTSHLYKVNVAAMTRRPLTFTACAILEILARWESHCGVPVSKLRLPSPISDRDESIMQVFQRSLTEFENLDRKSVV